jgi:hypothetical protein
MISTRDFARAVTWLPAVNRSNGWFKGQAVVITLKYAKFWPKSRVWKNFFPYMHLSSGEVHQRTKLNNERYKQK